MKTPEGYLKVCAVLQKYIDQGISVNTSYNPVYFEEEKIPMSTLLQDMLMFYKYGGKQLYYFNTFDGQGEIDVDKMTAEEPIERGEFEGSDAEYDDYCESCMI